MAPNHLPIWLMLVRRFLLRVIQSRYAKTSKIMKSNKTKKYMHDCSTNMAWLYNLLLFAWTFASVAIVISTSCTPFSMILPRCHKCVFFGNSVAFWIAKLLSKVEIRAESNVKWRVEVDIHNSTKYTYRSVLGKVYFLGNYVGNLLLTHLLTNTYARMPFQMLRL